MGTTPTHVFHTYQVCIRLVGPAREIFANPSTENVTGAVCAIYAVYSPSEKISDRGSLYISGGTAPAYPAQTATQTLLKKFDICSDKKKRPAGMLAGRHARPFKP